MYAVKRCCSCLEGVPEKLPYPNHELFSDMDLAKTINIQRIRWLGHVVRMDEPATPRRVFDAVVGGRWRVGRPRTRLKDQFEEALTSNDVTNWRRRAQSRGA